MPPLSTGKKLLFAAVSLLGTLVVTTIVAELALRATYGKIERITGVTEWQLDSWEELSYFWDRYDATLGWTNLPGYRSDDAVPFRVTINGQGLRAERDYPPRAEPGTQRIALFGDSCAFGEEVDDDETVSAYLEKMVARTEVLNFGVHGYGLGQMVLRLEQQGFDFHPDLVLVLVLLPSDIGRTASDRLGHPKPVFRVVDGELAIGNVPVPEASRQPWLLRRSFTAAWLWGRPTDWGEVASMAENLEITRAILERLRAACSERGVPCMLVPIVTAATLETIRGPGADPYGIEGMRAFLAASGFDVLDAIGFQDWIYAREGEALVAPHGHWSARGNGLLAEWIAQQLIERYPPPAPAP